MHFFQRRENRDEENRLNDTLHDYCRLNAIFHPLSVSLTISFYVCLPDTLLSPSSSLFSLSPLHLPPWLSTCLYLSLSHSPYFPLTLSLSLSLSLSLTHHLSLSLTQIISIYHSIEVNFSLFNTHLLIDRLSAPHLSIF